ncbi:hypothetical protein [Caminibacter sp.]
MKKGLIFLSSTLLFANITNNTFRVSFQNLKFQNEHIGLLETSYLFNFSHFYTGLSVYSAVTGKRGGFFTGGVTVGYKYPLSKAILDAGAFIGGGGGGHAPQGSGLMSKIYAGILFPYKKYNFGMNINHIKFKDGSIDSTQLALVMDYNFKDVYLNSPEIIKGRYSLEKMIFKPYVSEYFPFDSKTTTGKKQKRFSLIGAEIIKQNNGYFTFLNAAGAFRGESDGYAEYLLGFGKNLKFITLKASIGAAGGGEVDTKGGFVYKIEAEKNIKLLSFSAGFFNAPGGIKAYTLKGGIYKKFNLISTGDEYITYKPKKFEISLYSESYLPSSTIRKDRTSKRLDVLNVDIGVYSYNNIEYLINAGAAYNGGSGGYAVGMFGVKYSKKYWFLSGYIGAGGGGRIDVGGGMLAKIKAGIQYKHFFVSIGRIKAIDGRLNTTTLSAGIKYDFYK